MTDFAEQKRQVKKQKHSTSLLKLVMTVLNEGFKGLLSGNGSFSDQKCAYPCSSSGLSSDESETT